MKTSQMIRARVPHFSSAVHGSPSERLRLEMYKRLAEVRSDEDVDLINEEMLDRYGEPPQEVVSLLLVARFRARARRAGIGEVTIAGRNVRLTVAYRFCCAAPGPRSGCGTAGSAFWPACGCCCSR